MINPPKKEGEQNENGSDAHKAQFLGQGRKNKVGMAFRQKTQLGLSTMAQSPAQELAGTDGDLGLDDMVTLAQRVMIRVDKCPEPVLLVRPEQKGVNGNDQRGNYDEEGQNRFDGKARKKDDGPAGKNNQAGAEVRLKKDDQPGRDKRKDQEKRGRGEGGK